MLIYSFFSDEGSCSFAHCATKRHTDFFSVYKHTTLWSGLIVWTDYHCRYSGINNMYMKILFVRILVIICDCVNDVMHVGKCLFFFFYVSAAIYWLVVSRCYSFSVLINYMENCICRRIFRGFSLFCAPSAGVLCAYAANQNLSSQLKTMRKLVNSNLRDLYTVANNTPAVRT